MKRLFITVASACLLLPAGEATAQNRIEAILVHEDANPQRVWIAGTSRTEINYFEDEVTTILKKIPISKPKSVFFPEPPALSDAILLFRARDYKTALPAFTKVAADFQAVRTLPVNPSSLAAYYELECLRLLGQYDKISEKLNAFYKTGISREDQIRQLELNLMWEAVGRKAWDRLEHLVTQHAESRMPGGQIAQVAYCRGLVHEQKGEIDEAFLAFNEAMVADAGASEVIARMAALDILRIIHADPAVHTAREAWGTENEIKSSPGYARLVEAGAVARIYEEFIGAGSPLPDEFKDYLNYEAETQEP